MRSAAIKGPPVVPVWHWLNIRSHSQLILAPTITGGVFSDVLTLICLAVKNSFRNGCCGSASPSCFGLSLLCLVVHELNYMMQKLWGARLESPLTQQWGAVEWLSWFAFFFPKAFYRAEMTSGRLRRLRSLCQPSACLPLFSQMVLPSSWAHIYSLFPSLWLIKYDSLRKKCNPVVLMLRFSPVCPNMEGLELNIKSGPLSKVSLFLLECLSWILHSLWSLHPFRINLRSTAQTESYFERHMTWKLKHTLVMKCSVVCFFPPQTSELSIKLCFTYCGKEKVQVPTTGSFGEKRHSAAYHFHHLNGDYGNLQPALPSCSVTLLPLLSRLPRKPLLRLSQLAELWKQHQHTELKSTWGVKLHSPHHKSRNHPAGTREGTFAYKHMIHFSQLASALKRKCFDLLLKKLLLLCCSFQSVICKS